jgi:thymidylate kinase
MGRVFLDGMIAAGKTTLCSELRRRGVAVIPEYAELVEGNNKELSARIISALALRDTTPMGMIDASQELIDIELYRQNNFAGGIYDRSFMTLLAFNGIFTLLKHLPIRVLDDANKPFCAAIENKILALPNLSLTLNISADTSIQRQDTRARSEPNAIKELMRSKNFLQAFVLSQAALAECVEGFPSRIIDCERPQEEVAAELIPEILQVVNEPAQTTGGIDFEKFTYLIMQHQQND